MRFIFRVIGGFIFLLGIVAGYLTFFGTKDLRTETAINSPQPEYAKLLLQQMGEAHSISNWEGIETYSAEFEDQFLGVWGNRSNPYPEDTVQFLLTYIPNSFDGRLQFLSGEKTGLVWGMQSWKTYYNSQSHGFKFEESDEFKFWLPTYQYFIEFPKRIQNADALAYAGETTINEKLCEGVLASWNTTQPQMEVDQYLIWIEKSTKRIIKIEYTIREKFNFINGAVYFNDYKKFENLLLPTSMPVESNILEEGFLHKMSILNFSKNPIPQKELRPNRALKVMSES